MMKFLVISKTKDTFYTLTPEVRKQLHDGQEAFWEKNVKEGKLKEIYHLIGKHGTATIWEANSTEEAEEIFRDLPTYHYTHFKLYIISDWKKL